MAARRGETEADVLTVGVGLGPLRLLHMSETPTPFITFGKSSEKQHKVSTISTSFNLFVLFNHTHMKTEKKKDELLVYLSLEVLNKFFTKATFSL